VEVLDVHTRSSLLLSQASLTPAATAADQDHQLQWVGWSDDGPLHTVDTAGVVRMHTKSWGGTWVPVYDPRASPLTLAKDSTQPLWVWGVCDAHLFAHRCDGADAYPLPLVEGLRVEHVPLLLPLVRHPLDGTAAMTWEKMLRAQIRTDELKLRSSTYTAAIATRDAAHDKVLLGVFRDSLKDQRIMRAADVAEQLELRDGVERCAKEANAAGHTLLVRRLLAALEQRMKLKQKRRCALPLEGTVMDEKDRERLLRRLLAKEQESPVPSRHDNGALGDVAPRPQHAAPTLAAPANPAPVSQVRAADRQPASAKPIPPPQTPPSKPQVTTRPPAAMQLTPSKSPAAAAPPSKSPAAAAPPAPPFAAAPQQKLAAALPAPQQKPAAAQQRVTFQLSPSSASAAAVKKAVNPFAPTHQLPRTPPREVFSVADQKGSGGGAFASASSTSPAEPERRGGQDEDADHHVRDPFLAEDGEVGTASSLSRLAKTLSEVEEVAEQPQLGGALSEVLQRKRQREEDEEEGDVVPIPRIKH